jgi:trimeric autotransporter adhesin
MKKITLLFVLMLCIFVTANSQTTNYGTSSGTLGDGSYFGYFAGNGTTTSSYANSFFGYNSGRNTMSFGNTAIGARSLSANTSGYDNVATGRNSLADNTTGYENTSVGAFSLHRNTVGYGNTANGYQSLYFNRQGNYNVANGFQPLFFNSEGNYNIATGYQSMHYNDDGDYNIANGYRALYNNITGSHNIASGMMALYQNATGIHNVATGYYALKANENGILNSAYGSYALYNNSTGSFNSAIGYDAGPASTSPGLTNTTALGSNARPTASNQVRIGNSGVTSIGGQVSWSTLSDGRFKTDIKEDVSGLEFIIKLRPVSYSVDREAVSKFLQIPDSLRIQFQGERKNTARQTGFVAQEVEAIVKKTGYVFHGVEAPENENDHYSIRYAEFVVPLVKAVQELTAKMEDQQKEISTLKQQLSSNDNNGSLSDELNAKGAVLYQNHPNPFSLDTEINMALPESTGQATLIVYNMEGKQLKVIPIRERGKATAKIQANELKPGMYIYTLIVDSQVVDTKRMILTGY